MTMISNGINRYYLLTSSGKSSSSSSLLKILFIITIFTSRICSLRSAAFAVNKGLSSSLQNNRLTVTTRSLSLLAAAASASQPSGSSNKETMSTSSTTCSAITAPVAYRDNDRVVYAGIAPEGWDTKIPRQSESSTEKLMDPPVPVPDPYGWLRDEKRTNQQVLDHLKVENAYTEALTKHLTQDTKEGADDSVVTSLYKEFLSTIQETDYTTPRPHKDYLYYSRTIKGKAYTIHCRAPRTEIIKTLWKVGMTDEERGETPVLDGEEIILDVNKLAEGQSYCSTGSIKKSPSHKQLAYAVDFSGDEKCLLFVKDIATDKIIHEDPTLEIYGSLQWGINDNEIFFMKQDSAQRPYQVYRRTFINNDGKVEKKDDELLFEELNDLYWLGIYKSLDGKYLFIETSSKETTEIHYLDLETPDATLQCIAPRRSKVLYEIEHKDNKWWISSNVGGLPNMALFTSPAIPNSTDSWELVKDKNGNTLFDGGNDRALDNVSCFTNHVVAYGREGGLPRIWIIGEIENNDKSTVVNKFEMLSFPEDAYDVGLGTNYEYNADKVVVGYDSLVTPTQSLEINMYDTSKRTVLKEKEVPGYNKELYGCERITVTARDGKTEIPVSMVYRKDTMEKHMSNDDVPVPVHLYGYGSYGSCMEASFVSTRLPLLNRGIVYIIAHVRGGGEMGRIWYEEPNGAKYLCKQNTFNDFIDVGKWLIYNKKLTTSELLSCEGRSAGGLLIGASINQQPELFKVAILGVPFVDVVPTMIDASIPLTAVEWEEWGNPNEEKYFNYMMEYNPITNVKKAKYPSCLLTGGLHDPRVQYWEPSKFAAELRHSQSSESGPVCLKIDMSAGHFSASDRYKYLKEKAFDYAFILDQLGLL